MSLTFISAQRLTTQAVSDAPELSKAQETEELRKRSPHPLRDSDLWRTQAFINGKWVNAADRNTLTVHDPSNNAVLAHVPSMGEQETGHAIDAAQAAFPLWRQQTGKKRAHFLSRWADLMMANQYDLAVILSQEQGKPLKESLSEVAYSASFFEWFAEEAKRVEGNILASPWENKRVMVFKEPVGLVALITPWNFPSAMLARKIAPALAAGCVVVLKPSDLTPLSALALAELSTRIDLPPGVFNVVTGMAAPIGKTLLERQEVRKISFTGSTAVGKLLMRESAATLKRLSLELGGNAPFIVFNDADLDAAVEGCLASKFRNSGQTCVCANRIYVQNEIHAEFIEKLKTKVSALKVGRWDEPNVEQGPLINEKAVTKVMAHINDMLQAGGRLVCGGRRHGLGGTFIEPTIISHVSDHCLVSEEETFGPVAAIFRFETEEEVLKRANASKAGLAAYVYTRDMDRIWRVSAALETGIIGMNEGIISTEVAPFGGVKESGFGREGSRYGLDDYVATKYVLLG